MFNLKLFYYSENEIAAVYIILYKMYPNNGKSEYMIDAWKTYLDFILV